MFTQDDLPKLGFLTVHIEGHDVPALTDIPLNHVEVWHHEDGASVVIGDNHGMRVASLPFVEAERISDRMWRFVGPEEDFTVTIDEGAP
jgi:hypothetical protein